MVLFKEYRTLRIARICITILVFSSFFSCKNNQVDDREPRDSPSPSPHSTPSDSTPPTPGNSGTLVCSDNQALSIRVSWSKADDDTTAEADLSYRLYYSTDDPISTVAEIEAAGTPFGNWTKDLDSSVVTGLTSCRTYRFNILVRDSSGNRAAYAEASDDTLSILDNFEDGDLHNLAGSGTGDLWVGQATEGSLASGYTTDHVTTSISTNTPGGGEESLRIEITINGTEPVGAGAYNGGFSVGTEVPDPIDASAFTGFTFKARVASAGLAPLMAYTEEYRLILSSDTSSSSNILIPDFSPDWSTCTVPFADFDSGDPIADVLPELSSISLVYRIDTAAEFVCTADIYLDDVVFY